MGLVELITGKYSTFDKDSGAIKK